MTICKKYIGFGKWIKSYRFIFYAVGLKILVDNFFSFNSVFPQSDVSILGFESVISKHIIIQNFYKYFSFIIGGLLFRYIIKANTKEDKNGSIYFYNEKKESFLASPSLIHYKTNRINIIKYPLVEILLVSFLYALYFEYVDILNIFDIGNMSFWTLEIGLMMIFMKKYFVVTFYNFQKCSFIFMLVSVSLLLFIASVLPVKDIDNKIETPYHILASLVDEKYFLMFLVSVLINIFYFFISYTRVKLKVLTDLKYISPYTIIFFIGICGTIVTSFEIIFGSLFSCEGVYKEFCVTSDDNDIKYFDNIKIYFLNLAKKMKSSDKAYEFYLEILLLLPIFLVINFLHIICEFWIIIRLNPYFALIQNNFAYLITYLLYLIFERDTLQEKEYYLTRILLVMLAEMIAIICFFIYLQIIELRFCGLDIYLQRNLLLLAQIESDEGTNFDEEEEDKEKDIDSYCVTERLESIYT